MNYPFKTRLAIMQLSKWKFFRWLLAIELSLPKYVYKCKAGSITWNIPGLPSLFAGSELHCTLTITQSAVLDNSRRLSPTATRLSTVFGLFIWVRLRLALSEASSSKNAEVCVCYEGVCVYWETAQKGLTQAQSLTLWQIQRETATQTDLFMLPS